jgi:hypothetical protein
MNNKIQRFTTQLSEAAPVAPELECGARSVSPRPSIMAVRLSLAAAVLALVGVVAVVADDRDDRGAVVPASDAADSEAVIRAAVTDVLPADFRVVVVESFDARRGHVVAVSDRLDVLDIQFNTETPSQETPDTAPPITEAPVDAVCVAPVSNPDASECLQYADEASGTQIAPTTSNPIGQPRCYTFGNPLESVNVQDPSPTTSMPCSLEKLENQEIAVSNECTVYALSESDVPSSISECPQVAVIGDPNPSYTGPSDISSPANTLPAPPTSSWADEESFMSEAFGPDENGEVSPFTHAARRDDDVFVSVTLFSLERRVDLTSLVDALSRNFVAIDNVGMVIDSLPDAVAPVDLHSATPTSEDSWTSRGVITGSLSVLLSKQSDDGAVVAQMSFPGSLEAAGNNGEIFWHGTTIDGVVSIALFQRGDRAMMTDEDTKALVRKIAEGWVDETASALASPESNDTSPPTTEAPVDTAAP